MDAEQYATLLADEKVINAFSVMLKPLIEKQQHKVTQLEAVAKQQKEKKMSDLVERLDSTEQQYKK